MKYYANSDNSSAARNHTEEVARTGLAFVSAFSALACGRGGHGLFNGKSQMLPTTHNNSSTASDEKLALPHVA